MERRSGIGTVEVTEAAEVRSALPRTTTLTSEEEKILRMRYAATAPLDQPLPNTALASAEMQDELVFLEMQLLKDYRAHLASKAVKVARVAWPGGSGGNSRAKDKILRALRKKR